MRIIKLLLLLIILFSSKVFSQETTSANQIVLEAAKSKLGKRVKTGICFDLIDYSLSKADRHWKDRTGSANYIYGREVKKEDAKPGDVVYFSNCRFKGGHIICSHVVILVTSDNIKEKSVDVIEQNYNVKTLKESRVVINKMDLSDDSFIKGKMRFYRPY